MPKMPLTTFTIRLPRIKCINDSSTLNTAESAKEILLPATKSSNQSLIISDDKSILELENSANDESEFQDEMMFKSFGKSTQKVSDYGLSDVGGTNSRDNVADGFFFGNYTRYVVLTISTLCLSMTMSNSLAFNFTVICMTSEENETYPLQGNLSVETGGLLSNTDDVQSTSSEKFTYSQAEKSLLFSAVAIGTLVGSFPITFFTSKYGVRKTFTAYGLISAISTLLSPLCVWIGFIPFFAMRFFQGFAMSTSFPAMGAIINHWSTLRNSGMYIALLSCHLQFGAIFTMPIAGELCESRWGWPALYYLQGVLTLFTFALFFSFYKDAPRFHRNVSAKELKTIEKGKNVESSSRQVPYGLILRDISVWGVFASTIGGALGFQIFLQYGPIYLNKALKFNVQNTGIAAALPYILSAIIKFIVGPFSDHFTFVSARARVIIFATASQMLMSCCFLALAILPIENPILIQTCFTLSTVFSGLNCVGVAKSTQLMSRQFSHVLMAANGIITSVVVILLPLIVALLVPNNTVEEWARIFILIAAIVITTTLIFDYTAEVDPRPWTYTAKTSQSALLTKTKLFTTDIVSPDSMEYMNGRKSAELPKFSVSP